MYEPQPLPLWSIPFFLLLFPAIWLLVIGGLAELGGWSDLARLYREAPGTVRKPLQRFSMGSLDLRRGWFPLPVNYGGCAVIELAAAGIHLRTWAVLRFRHPPLLIPWSQIEQVRPGRFLFFRTLAIQPRGTTTRVRLWGAAGRAVEEGWEQRAIAVAKPARV